MSARKSRLLAAAIALIGCSRGDVPHAEAQVQPKAAAPAQPLGPSGAAGGAERSGTIVPIAGAPTSFVQLVKRARASVVNIHSTAIVHQRAQRYYFFGEDSPFYQLVQPPDQRTQSLGTGFIVSAEGDIITNNHVIAPSQDGRVADQIVVKLDDKREYKARVIARDPPTDVALLHIDAKGLQPSQLGDSDALEVGEWVVAIGEPFGLQSTVTAGIVSAKGRRGDELGGGLNRGYWDFIQTDCAINPGNSGGPLMNMRGEVVGINTAINANAQGLAFAVPINMAKRVVDDLRKYKRVQRGWVGLYAADNPRRYGYDLPTGALVEQVVRNSPAAHAGVRPGDVVLKFDGVSVDDAERLRWLLANAGVGKQIVLRVAREGAGEADVKITTSLQPGQD